MSQTPPEVDSAVRALFQVNDFFQLPEGEGEYRVEYGADSKAHFAELAGQMASGGYTPSLTGSTQDCTLLLKRKQPPAEARSRVIPILILLTLFSVAAFALLEQQIYGVFAPEVPGYLVVFAYIVSVVAILGAHELGHRLAAMRSGSAAPASYFIPGIPDVTQFLPSLGIISAQRQPAVNRDSFFDLMVLGPLLGILVALAFYALGEVAAVQSSLPLVAGAPLGPYVSVSQINPSVLQLGVDALFTGVVPAVPDGFVKLSPLADAATVGFFVSFLSLLPMALFDGGYIVTTVIGGRAARATTYLSVLGLIALDTPHYWAIAVVVLLIGGRQANVQLLDGVSPVSKAKKAIFGAALVLAFLLVPIPQNILTFPLG